MLHLLKTRADSLDTVELVMAFEEEFGAEILDEDAEKLTSVGGVVTYLKEKGLEEIFCFRKPDRLRLWATGYFYLQHVF